MCSVYIVKIAYGRGISSNQILVENLLLQPFIDTDKLKKVGKMFEHVSFQHLYRELNDHAD